MGCEGERAIRDGKAVLKPSEVHVSSQRGHSSRRAGKPRTGRRATACQLPQSTTLPNGERLGILADVVRKETRVKVLAGGRRVR